MSIFLGLLGGLGLFLFGMNLMSKGLENAAGGKPRGILEVLTTNQFLGLFVGIVFTAAIQSSSAMTVIAVSFVNSGMMTLNQAAGIIFGANIGTTVTSQLVAFNLSEIAPVFLFAGVVMSTFMKNNRVQKVGQIVLGFGILFMGLTEMSSAMENIKNNEMLTNVLTSLHSHLLAVLIGTVVTAVIQSSSVTVSIILLMANQGLLELKICFFIILGCNIGACASALLASLAGKKDAKRAAMIHFLFNIIGSIILYLLLTVDIDLIEQMILTISGNNMGRCVANAHTAFKIFQVILLFPFAKQIVKLTYLIIPGEDKQQEEEFYLEYIGDNAIFSPTLATTEAIKEIERMAHMAKANVNRGVQALMTMDERTIQKAHKTERQIDYLDREITDYLVRINQMTIPTSDQNRLGALLHVVNDIERIADHADNAVKAAELRMEKGFSFSKKAVKELKEITALVDQIFDYAIITFVENTQEHLSEISRLEEEIDQKEREIQRAHVKRIQKKKCSPDAGMIYTDIISGMERMADHAVSMSFAIAEEDTVFDK